MTIDHNTFHINFDADRDILDLHPIPREVLSKLDAGQLETVKNRWWQLFSKKLNGYGNPCFATKFIDVVDNLGEKIPGELNNHVNIHSGDLFIISNDKFYSATWKGKAVVNSGKKLFVPGAWMNELEKLYAKVEEIRTTKALETEERQKNEFLDMLVAE